jgi:hypothetical protein
MTLTIELTPDEEAQLLVAARLEGLEAAEYARRRLLEELAGPSLPMTGAEAVGYWERQGLTGSYGDPELDAPTLARKLRREVWGGLMDAADQEQPSEDVA